MFHTAGNKEKKKKILDAVGWKSYCSMLYCGAGRAAWAPGLALGSALDALGPFLIRFDSFFFLESPNEHCSL